MECPKCKFRLKRIGVDIEGARNKAISYQCLKCGYFNFESMSAERVIKELKIKETPLLIQQKIIKLSKGRIGMYFNRDIARSLNLKGGEQILIAVPDKKRIVVNINKKN